MPIKKFSSLIQLVRAFPDEQDCIDYLEEIRWGGKVVSPFDSISKVYKCKNNQYRCKNTGKYFNVRTRSFMESSNLPSIKWLMAVYLLTANKAGISSKQLARDIDVTQPTAWLMLQRLRNCIAKENEGELFGTIEVDESFVGGLNKNRHKDKRVPKSQGRSHKDKTPVFGMIERGGKLIAKVVPNTKRKTLMPIIKKYIQKGSTIYSDEWWAYRTLGDTYNHDYINHAAKQYCHGDVTTNSVESAWALLKRAVKKTYIYTSRKHLQRYVDEFVFRFNTRKLSEYERFNLFLQSMENRLPHKQLVSG